MRKAVQIVMMLGLGAALVAAVRYLPAREWTEALITAVRGAGAVGVVIYAGAYVVATFLLLPGSVLTLAAGFLYGPVWGVALVSPVSVLAATLSFMLARGAGRPWVTRRLAAHPRLAALTGAVAGDGFKIVLLLRLSPLFPFNLLNYALGLTPLRLRDYVLASFIGMFAGTAVYVYLGSLVPSVAELFAGASGATPLQRALYWGGLAATLFASALISRAARAALNKALPESVASTIVAGAKP